MHLLKGLDRTLPGQLLHGIFCNSVRFFIMKHRMMRAYKLLHRVAVYPGIGFICIYRIPVEIDDRHAKTRVIRYGLELPYLFFPFLPLRNITRDAHGSDNFPPAVKDGALDGLQYRFFSVLIGKRLFNFYRFFLLHNPSVIRYVTLRFFRPEIEVRLSLDLFSRNATASAEGLVHMDIPRFSALEPCNVGNVVEKCAEFALFPYQFLFSLPSLKDIYDKNKNDGSENKDKEQAHQKQFSRNIIKA